MAGRRRQYTAMHVSQEEGRGHTVRETRDVRTVEQQGCRHHSAHAQTDARLRVERRSEKRGCREGAAARCFTGCRRQWCVCALVLRERSVRVQAHVGEERRKGRRGDGEARDARAAHSCRAGSLSLWQRGSHTSRSCTLPPIPTRSTLKHHLQPSVEHRQLLNRRQRRPLLPVRHESAHYRGVPLQQRAGAVV